ncbi:dihydropteroate synthase [Phenylobacterium montanum]|uniref:dihydropteroate synthase n=1 Tax=Phenylobacterium montanum TaxID=2823693 RepID=A0A975FYF3_9CAUL|nr:dihydropteroate synthase [Caulobacter sp. S6]QUD87132.1 dihydropteroate synthase [Caulobacter sp. S6]
MGVVNITPDSFSDGGRFLEEPAAVSHARRLVAEGADLLDIGGESTRPGAAPVSEAEELARVIPVIRAIRAESAIPISVDTMKPAVARAAIEAGANIWNDVMALGAPSAPETAAELGCEVILMHMLGDPRTMQDDPRYDDVVEDVAARLMQRVEAAVAAGVRREAIWLDPGVGFGKKLEHNLALIAHMDRLVGLGHRVLLGASRKSMIRKIDPAGATAADRLGGSLAVVLAGARAGVAAVRVHDVRETRQALMTQAAIDAAR